MRIRPLADKDIPVIEQIFRESGFDYELPDLDSLVTVQVIADEDDNLIAACGAEALAQLYLWVRPGESKHACLAAIRLLHRALGEELRQKGYHEAEVALPGPIAKRFGRFLSRRFGWTKNAWEIWFLRF